jgi:NAD(P)-dependent dehydrogenase (short-subunit alcohol dehydrogenase family)
MSDRLKDKVALITGIGGSIGQQAALAFAREGARVVGSGQNAGDATTSIRLAAVRRTACGRKPRVGRRSTRGRSPVR